MDNTTETTFHKIQKGEPLTPKEEKRRKAIEAAKKMLGANYQQSIANLAIGFKIGANHAIELERHCRQWGQLMKIQQRTKKNEPKHLRHEQKKNARQGRKLERDLEKEWKKVCGGMIERGEEPKGVSTKFYLIFLREKEKIRREKKGYTEAELRILIHNHFGEFRNFAFVPLPDKADQMCRNLYKRNGVDSLLELFLSWEGKKWSADKFCTTEQIL